MVTHKTKEMLWKQILENPRDEELRLIYADVLEELGEVEISERIRRQDHKVYYNFYPYTTGYWRGWQFCIFVPFIDFSTRVDWVKEAIRSNPIGEIYIKEFRGENLFRYWWGARIEGLSKVYEPAKFDSDCSDRHAAIKVLELNFPSVKFDFAPLSYR